MEMYIVTSTFSPPVLSASPASHPKRNYAQSQGLRGNCRTPFLHTIIDANQGPSGFEKSDSLKPSSSRPV